MTTYKKSAIISLVMGMLSASLGVALMDFESFGLGVAIKSFFTALPRSTIIGGLPSLALATIALVFWKKFGKSENGMMLICLLIGVIIGYLCKGILYISFGI